MWISTSTPGRSTSVRRSGTKSRRAPTPTITAGPPDSVPIGPPGSTMPITVGNGRPRSPRTITAISRPEQPRPSTTLTSPSSGRESSSRLRASLPSRSRICGFSGLLRQRYSLVARFALSYRTRCPLVMGGRSATHVVGSSARPLGGRRRVAAVDDVITAGPAEWPRVHITAAACPEAVPAFTTTDPGNGRHANGKTHQCRACDANANSSSQPYSQARNNTNSDGNAATDGDTDTGDNSFTNAGSDTNSDSDSNANSNPDPGSNADAYPDPRASDLQP